MPKYLYQYHEERGRFDAYVSDKDGNTVWEVHYPDYYEDEFTGEMVEGSTIFDDGYMKSVDDVDGLEKYLKGVGVLSPTCELTMDEDEMEEKYAEGGKLKSYNYYVDGGSISEEEQISGESDKVNEISDTIDNLSEDISEENTKLPTKFVGIYNFDVSDTYALNRAIETIKKMSKKFGIKLPEIIIGEARLVGIDYDEIWGEYKYKVNLIPVTIKVENIFKLQEYEVLGVVDNATGGSVKFLDEKIPNEYLNPSQVCDLCKTNRQRGKTWIVKKISTGEYFRFGSDCVKRVFGINPMTYIRALDYFRGLNDIFSEFDKDSGGGGKKRISPKMRVIPFDIALTVVKEVYDKVGYVKKLWEEEEVSFGRYEKYRINEGQATADIVENKLLDEKYAHSVVPNTEFLNNFKGFWLSLEIVNNSPFEQFLKFLNKIKKQVIDEEFRIIDSGMFSFSINYMQQAKKQAERKPSNYIGVVGDKYDFVNLKLIDWRVFDSQFGQNTLWTFVDENENIIKKFGELDTSFYVGSESGKDARLEYIEQNNLSYFVNNYDPQIGDLFSFTAQIKKHEEYRGVKSTIIGRTSKTKIPKKKKLEYGEELEYAKGGDIDKTYFSSFAETVDAIYDYADYNGYEVKEIFPDITYGGISYGQTKKFTVDVEWNGMEKRGKSKKREKNTIIATIYRMDSGNYELVMYFAYAKGGDIETEIKNKLEKATSESENGMALQYEFAVYVPSTEGANQIINKKEFQKRIDEVQLYLSRLFGGYSSSEVDGGYDSTEKGLIQEDIVRVVAFATKKAAKDNFNELINQLGIWAEKWGQEAIGLEFEGDMFYVDKKTKLKRGGFLKKSLRPSVNAFKKRYEMANNGVDSYYKEGGATKRKSGNVPRIEKRVDELNKLIEIANQNNLSIIDTSGTWQTQERYKPLRYVNGILYLNWEELDLYSYLKQRGEKWDMKKDKVLKRNMESDGIPTINNLMRLYKKRLKQEGLTF